MASKPYPDLKETDTMPDNSHAMLMAVQIMQDTLARIPKYDRFDAIRASEREQVEQALDVWEKRLCDLHNFIRVTSKDQEG